MSVYAARLTTATPYTSASAAAFGLLLMCWVMLISDEIKKRTTIVYLNPLRNDDDSIRRFYKDRQDAVYQLLSDKTQLCGGKFASRNVY